ncbi:bifunctional apoptosis regulator-like isoform X2 [Trichomycterus rosablanca]
MAGHCVVNIDPVNPRVEDEDDGHDEGEEEDEDLAAGISLPEVTCPCCYEVLLDPTTLTCGHSFCRHCLAQWLHSSGRAVCPTCRRAWQGFPKVNISFRDLVEKHFQSDLAKKRQRVLGDPHVAQSLLVLQGVEHRLSRRPSPPIVWWHQWLGKRSFFSGVLLTLSFVAVVFLVYHLGGEEGKVELLLKKPIGAWTTDEVTLWVESLGTWASPYRDTFLREQVNGRLLSALSEQDFSAPPYLIENELHRRAVLKEVRRVQELGFKRPRNLWEYKAVNGGKSLFYSYAMTDSPRLTLLYMYMFDYHDSFLPFIHTSCPSALNSSSEEALSFRNLEEPNRMQWLAFGVKFVLLPYQLISDFAWHWMDVHYWTARIVMWHALMLTLREGDLVWRLRGHLNLRTIPSIFTGHVCQMAAVFFSGLILWRFLPQFLWDRLFHWVIYFLPVTSTVTLLGPYVGLLRVNIPH